MGLFDAQQPQGNTAEPQSATQPQVHRFNGTVQSDEGPIDVKDGVANVGGETYYVSDDGQYVVDASKNLVAVIQNGKVVEITPEILDQLKQQGVIAGDNEVEQPQNMANPAPK